MWEKNVLWMKRIILLSVFSSFLGLPTYSPAVDILIDPDDLAVLTRVASAPRRHSESARELPSPHLPRLLLKEHGGGPGVATAAEEPAARLSSDI